MTIRAIYTGPRGFVTDFGEPLTLTGPDNTVTILPRYGVWTFDLRKLKYQVALTTDDLAVAIAVAEESDESETRTVVSATRHQRASATRGRGLPDAADCDSRHGPQVPLGLSRLQTDGDQMSTINTPLDTDRFHLQGKYTWPRFTRASRSLTGAVLSLVGLKGDGSNGHEMH